MKPNHLSHEKSPYLLQHANNPVDWYPWSEEALGLSKKTGKPIFLSIGYSTCHWCHVMAHESFENTATAALMNQHFINIKVDREERPDIDAIYMNAVQALTGSGGWPMSVWLTPDLKPFYGGTYFPPDERFGRPGFPTVLKQLAEIWENENQKAKESADQITSMLKQYVEGKQIKDQPLPDAGKAIQMALRTISVSFDPKEGGFGPAPKFPMPVFMNFLLWYHRRTGDEKALNMVLFTMKKIAGGGITDQLGGGFSRYSTDETWTVPHFEKMLYDNAQLISVTASLYQLSKDPMWSDLTRRAVNYVLRDLKHPDGAFYSAEDADSEGKEGTFYLWTLAEIKKHLDEKSAEAFIRHYGVTLEGNFFDPHTRETGQNVLVLKYPDERNETLAAAEKTLFDLRNRRPRPHRDDKILTEWNGLMISALAHAGRFLGESSYFEQAAQAAAFLQKNLYDPTSKILYRRWRNGERKIEAQQADYAALVQGLLDLHDSNTKGPWLEWAVALEEIQDKLFFDFELGGYFMNVPRADVFIRLKDDNDNVTPSGNSVAVLNGLRLAKLTGKGYFSDKARLTLQAFGSKLEQNPASLAVMVTALAQL